MQHFHCVCFKIKKKGNMRLIGYTIILVLFTISSIIMWSFLQIQNNDNFKNDKEFNKQNTTVVLVIISSSPESLQRKVMRGTFLHKDER